MNTQMRTLRWLSVVCLVTLSACSSGNGGGAAALPGTLQLSATSFDATEGTIVNIMVTRSGGSSGVVSVDYATADGTALAGTDYPAMNGTLTYADGVSGNQTISIAMTDDTTAEHSESFTVTLSNASRATLGANSSASVNIVDDDSAALPITANNAQFITADVLEAITSTIDLIDVVDLIGIPTLSGTNFSVARFPLNDIITETVPCDSGEATVTWDDADNDLMLSTGDTFDIFFNMCFFADTGTTLDGANSLTNLIVEGDPVDEIVPWRLATTIGFDNLSATDGTGSVSLDGSLDLDLSSDDNVVVNLSIGTASLTAQQAGTTETLTDYALTATFDLSALTEVVSTSGTLASSLLEGTVTFESLEDFLVMGDDFPSAGQLLISDSSSSVLATVLSNINVQLEIDFDLDGTIDQTIVVPWSQLDFD